MQIDSLHGDSDTSIVEQAMSRWVSVKLTVNEDKDSELSDVCDRY